MRTGRGFRHLTTLIAVAILLSLIAIGAILFPNFAAPSNLANLLGDYAYVGIAAVGATLVIASGGIDLSVGSLVAFTAVITGWLIARGWHPLAAGAMGLAAGASCGAVMGWLIQAFELPPFIVTLVGMFALRAGCFVVTGQSQGISHPFLDRVTVAVRVFHYQLTLYDVGTVLDYIDRHVSHRCSDLRIAGGERQNRRGCTNPPLSSCGR